MENTTITDLPRPDPAPRDQLDIKEAARNLGFKQVQAWIPSYVQSNKSSKGADRTRRSREKTLGQGSKQISVTLPVELHGPIKELAIRTRSGEPTAQVIAELFPLIVARQTAPSIQEARPATIVTSDFSLFGGLPFWQRWLVRMLLPGKVREALISNSQSG